MIKWSLLFFLGLFPFLLCASEEVTEEIEISGKFKFEYVDTDGEFHLGEFINSSLEIKNASTCKLQLVSEDDFFNFYSGGFELHTLEPGLIVPFLELHSRYVDEEGQYWKMKINSASMHVAGITTGADWTLNNPNYQYILMDTSITTGAEMFHHITMGQPVTIMLERLVKPKKITINVAPIKGKVAANARKCIKVIHGD
jgi:hypothetical protein